MKHTHTLLMLNGLTKGILKIEPKYEDGTPVLDFYDCEMLLENGAEMKEWVAFADYLTSFESGKEDKPAIPDRYARQEGRKVKISEGGLKVLRHPGTITWVIMILCVLLMLAVGKIAAKVFRKTKKTSSSFQKP